MTQISDAPAKTRAQISQNTLRTDRWWEQPAIVAPADHLGCLRDRARPHRQVVLRAAVPLPDPVLLAVHQRRVHAGLGQPRHLDSGHLPPIIPYAFGLICRSCWASG